MNEHEEEQSTYLMQLGRPQERERKGKYSPPVLYNISRAFEIDIILEMGFSFDHHATLLSGSFPTSWELQINSLRLLFLSVLCPMKEGEFGR